MSPLEYCQQKIRADGHGFTAGLYLPNNIPPALAVLFAFCRELEDVAGGCTDAGVARAAFEWWRQDTAKAFQAAAVPEHPVNQALKQQLVDKKLPQQEWLELINGTEMALGHARYAGFADLEYVCYRTAGTAVKLMARILGFTRRQTLRCAETIGLALKLTDIIAKVGQDARHGCIFLPADELQRFNVPAQTILSATPGSGFAELMRFQAARAAETYRQAVALLPPEDQAAQKPVLVMAGIQYALLQEIEADGLQNVLRYRIRLPKPRQQRLALKYRLFGFKP